MPTAAQVKYLRELTGSGMMDVKAALAKAGDDPWLAMGFLRVKGLAVAIKKRLPDGTSRPATREEADAYWAREARVLAEEYRRDRPGLADDIARMGREESEEAARRAAGGLTHSAVGRWGIDRGWAMGEDFVLSGPGGLRVDLSGPEMRVTVADGAGERLLASGRPSEFRLSEEGDIVGPGIEDGLAAACALAPAPRL
jgi:hypothetical protein